MKNRGVVVLVAAVALLGGYLAWDMRSEKAAEETKTKESLIFPYAVDQVNEIVIENAKGGRTRLAKTIDGWKLEEPLKDDADSGFTDDFLGKIMKEGYKEVAKEGDGIDWKIYGLDNPIGKITVKTQTGQGKSLEVSAKQNFEENAIARISGENRVLIVPWSWSANAGRTALDFRDKRLFRHRIASVERLELTNPEGTFTVESKDGRWITPANPEWLLDQNRVRELLSMLNESRVADFVTEGSPLKTQVGDYGLATPKVRIKAKLKDKPWDVQIGTVARPEPGKAASKVPPGEYASVSDPAFLVRLDDGVLAKFEKLTLDGLRDKKKPFDFNKDPVKRIEFETPLKKAVFTKNGETWGLTDGAEGVTVDSLKVQDLVDQLKSATVARYALVKAAFKPVNHVRLKGADGALVFSIDWTVPSKDKIEGRAAEVVLAKTNLSPDVLILEASTIDKMTLHKLIKEKPQPKASEAPEKPLEGAAEKPAEAPAAPAEAKDGP